MNVLVAGLNIDASYTGSARLCRAPPVSKTLPSGSSTADTYILPWVAVCATPPVILPLGSSGPAW
ncbi:hypothetical protein [Actinoplanes nipponensis]|uniref:hypothetical protein n=1 Tax=Actinoplanes nipponensis TaxID=135950 RepID=UPI0031E60B40